MWLTVLFLMAFAIAPVSGYVIDHVLRRAYARGMCDFCSQVLDVLDVHHLAPGDLFEVVANEKGALTLRRVDRKEEES